MTDSIWNLLGLGGISLGVIFALLVAVNIQWAILSAILTTRRGRNAWNWFFLTFFYGLFGLLALACSKTINQGGKREGDNLSKVLWAAVIVPIILISALLVTLSLEKKRDDELTRKVLEDMKREEQMYNPNRDDAYDNGMGRNYNRDDYPWQ